MISSQKEEPNPNLIILTEEQEKFWQDWYNSLNSDFDQFDINQRSGL